MKRRTRLVHPRRSVPEGFRSLAVPVYRGSTTLFPRAAAVRDTWDHDQAAYTYGAYGTPTTVELADRIAELEGAHRTFVTPGGQAALTLVYLACCSAGDHVLVPANVYGPSRDFADRVLRRFGVDVEYYAPLDLDALAARLRPATRLVWCESPGSLTMEIQDVPAIAAAAHAAGALVALDNTYAAGVLFDAFAHGVDLSIQALTKYAGGHSDLLLGTVSVRDEALYRRVGPVLQDLGCSVSPDDCSLALRGLQTLDVRLAAIGASALEVARWFAGRDDVESVRHPALESCPGHAVWRRDFSGAAGLFSVLFRPPWTRAALHQALDRLTLFGLGYSWGGVTSLAVTPGFAGRDDGGRFGDRLVRFSIGLEDPGDLVADLDRAFRR